MHCFICDEESDNITIDSRDNKLGPCPKCQQVINKTVEQLERRQMAKEKRMLLWHNETTGEHSLDNLSDLEIEELDDDDIDEILDGFHFVDDSEYE